MVSPRSLDGLSYTYRVDAYGYLPGYLARIILGKIRTDDKQTACYHADMSSSDATLCGANRIQSDPETKRTIVQ